MTAIEQDAASPAVDEEAWVAPGATAAYRARFRRETIPRAYSRAIHGASTVLAVAALTGYGIALLGHPRPIEWLWMPALILFWNLWTYVEHRFALHRPWRPLLYPYRAHTLEHHRFFTHEARTVDEARDYHILLFPPVVTWAYVLLLVGAHAALRPALGDPLAGMLVISAGLYFGAYEAIHTVSHLKDGHVLAGLPILRALRRHHILHHDPRLMGRANFNVVFPLCDWLFATLHRDPPRPQDGPRDPRDEQATPPRAAE